MKNKNIQFVTQAAMIAAIYVVLTICVRAVFSYRRGAGSYCRSPDDPSGVHPCRYPRVVRRMPGREHL